MDKNNLFNYSQVNFKEFADEKWQKWDDNEFKDTFSDINDPLFNKIKKENSFKFSHLIMSLSIFSLTLSQTNSDSNRSNENTVSVKISNFENVNTQSKDAKPDTKSAQLFSDFVEEKVDDLFTDSLTLLLIILTH